MKKYLSLLAVLAMAIVCASQQTHADDLKNISLEYCTATGNILSYTLETETQTGICYRVSNTSEQPITVKINFIDGSFTNDQRQNRACLDDTSKQNFGQYVTSYEELITLTGGETKEQTASIKYPAGTDGRYHGCVTYSVVAPSENTQGGSSNFTILMRKAKFVDVLVGHPENKKGIITLVDFPVASGENISPNPKIRIYIDPSDNKYIVELTVKNGGTTEEDLIITGVASNILMFKQTFIDTRKILPGEELIIKQKLNDIPSYDLNVDIQLAHTPVIPGLPDVTPQTSYIHEVAHIIIFNIVTYATLVGLLILLIIIILLIRAATRRKKDKQTGTQIPVPPVQPQQPTIPVQPVMPNPQPAPQQPTIIPPPPTGI